MGGDYISDTAFWWFCGLTIAGLLIALCVVAVQELRKDEDET